ncbi:MAG TPA: MAPEG family protein [Asticcacaulis sp.]|nr:MAPEG family protein [Asticcacaulis sp.]
MSLDKLFLLPFVLHFALVMGLYVWLTVLRQTAMAQGEVKPVEFVNAGADPSRSKRVARNLSNQFELPVYALFAALFLYFSHRVSTWDVAAAWLFLTGRLIHTTVQTLTLNVPLRGLVFTVNCIGIVMLMVHVARIVFNLP